MSARTEILKKTFVPAVLNSYSVVFFFNNQVIGGILLLISFFNFQAGLSGLISVVATVLIARQMGYDEIRLKQGIYSFNSLLTGLGIGTFFDPGFAFFVLLLLSVIVCLMLSVTLSAWFGKYGLPFLSIPFVLSFWLILLPSSQLANLGLTHRNIFWMNEMYGIGGKPLLDFFQTIENMPLNRLIIIYLRSLSSIVFQDNVFSGILIAACILGGSRISFLLSVTGFLTAYLFAVIAGSDMAGFSFYNVGANYILVAIAAGGFFIIPSKYSFLWVIILIPLTSLLILALSKITGSFGIPLLSLPFSFTVISFVYFLVLRLKPGKLVLTPFQFYSPEVNLYSFRGNIDRNTGYFYFPFHLPFWGTWKVSQGYDGKITHKGDWSSAIDFVITDSNDSTHAQTGEECGDYYCFDKPVLAPADGIVTEIADNIDDNEPGKINTVQNWGNTVIIKHQNNLYSQLSHLRGGSIKFKQGEYVRKGDVVGLCGNSGRSPEPHIHFQVQSVPLPGAKPLAYPFSYYFLEKEGGRKLMSWSVPSETEKISNVLASSLFMEAFDFQPGMIVKFRYTVNDGPELDVLWEVFTDAYNHKYLYCQSSQSTAWFVNDGTMFYFTSFHGDRNSLLYYFYLSAYKILQGYYDDVIINDQFPVHIIAGNTVPLWLHDIIAPFRQVMKASFSARTAWADSQVNPANVRIVSHVNLSGLFGIREVGIGQIVLSENNVSGFSFESVKKRIRAWREES